MASRERQAVVETRGSRWQRFWQTWKFRLNELFDPVTIPATGGFFSSCILFLLLALTIGRTTQVVAYDVPVNYSETHAEATLVPLELRSSVFVFLSLNPDGRITDYTVRNATDSFVGDANMLQAKNIPIPEFPSVLAVAQPISSDISIRFTPLLFRQ
ncbi:MAG TPA: hypothetical protein VH302_11135 [Bryobacteraceae bacterium]|jgi:hypothetical protein|nr:hypothetical protein [Bryobacteraceae bacterium]